MGEQRYYAVLALAGLLLTGCSDSHDGECVYFSNLHTQYDEENCEQQTSELECESWELEDRSDGTETVKACVYTGCKGVFMCEDFRDL